MLYDVTYFKIFYVLLYIIYNITLYFFFKSIIYYMEYDGILCLQKELYIKYQYSNLFMQLPNTKDY